VASAPQTLTLKRNRDREGLAWHAWVRRGLLALLAVVLALALANVFGQRPHVSLASSPDARLKVFAPIHARSGLVYAARFHIYAIHELKHATLVLDPGWAEGYTFNGSVPGALTEASRDGRLVFDFGHIPAGKSLIYFVSLQVNPTNVGRRTQNVELDDGSRRLLTIHRNITIFP
jgi:hypothetical protein